MAENKKDEVTNAEKNKNAEVTKNEDTANADTIENNGWVDVEAENKKFFKMIDNRTLEQLEAIIKDWEVWENCDAEVCLDYVKRALAKKRAEVKKNTEKKETEKQTNKPKTNTNTQNKKIKIKLICDVLTNDWKLKKDDVLEVSKEELENFAESFYKLV